MTPQRTTLDKQRHSELFEGFLSPEEFRERAKPGKRPPTLRTVYRWMQRGMVAWVQWGDQRFIDASGRRQRWLARAGMVRDARARVCVMTAGDHSDLAVLCEAVARIVWGEPSSETTRELRWGTHGSRVVESFNARLRDELLDGQIFYTLREAKSSSRPHASWRPSSLSWCS